MLIFNISKIMSFSKRKNWKTSSTKFMFFCSDFDENNIGCGSEEFKVKINTNLRKYKFGLELRYFYRPDSEMLTSNAREPVDSVFIFK